MHAILFLPNDYLLCWAGRVPAGTPPRALARRIEREAPRQVLRLGEPLTPSRPPAQALEDLPGLYFDADGVDLNGVGPDESVLLHPPERVIAMRAILDVLVVGGGLTGGLTDRLPKGFTDRLPNPRPTSDRYGLAQRFIIPENLALRVAILPDALLVRADPPLILCAEPSGGEGPSAPRIPTLTAEERGLLRMLSRGATIREARETLGCSRRRVFYTLAQIRRKVGRMIREMEGG